MKYYTGKDIGDMSPHIFFYNFAGIWTAISGLVLIFSIFLGAMVSGSYATAEKVFQGLVVLSIISIVIGCVFGNKSARLEMGYFKLQKSAIKSNIMMKYDLTEVDLLDCSESKFLKMAGVDYDSLFLDFRIDIYTGSSDRYKNIKCRFNTETGEPFLKNISDYQGLTNLEREKVLP